MTTVKKKRETEKIKKLGILMRKGKEQKQEQWVMITQNECREEEAATKQAATLVGQRERRRKQRNNTSSKT